MTEHLDWRGRTVAWERLGDGPDLVLCHGTPWSSALWRPIAERLASDYRQIAQADERYTEELEPLLGGLDLPVRVVWGAEDTWIPPDRAARLQDAIPGATVRLLPEAGHLIQYDASEELYDELAAWLASQDVRGAQPSAG